MALTIKTNNIPRPVLHWWELSDKERKEFDYIFDGEGDVFNTFIRYKGDVYDLGEFYRCITPNGEDVFKGWDGYQSDSFFSGLLVKYTNDGESVIVGRYYS